MGKRVGSPPLVLESPDVVSLVRMLEQLWRTYGSIVQKTRSALALLVSRFT